jgi:nucleoid-associated protein YgaU
MSAPGLPGSVVVGDSDRRQRWHGQAFATLDRARNPLVWAGVLLVLLVVVLAAHHPIARAIGTEDSTGSAAPLTIAAPAAPVTPEATSQDHSRPVPEHAPINPFQALVNAQGGAVAPVAIPLRGLTKRQRHLTHGTAAGTAVVPTVTSHHHAATAPTGAGSSQQQAVGGAPSATAPGPSSGAHVASGTCSATHVVRAGDSLWSIAKDLSLGRSHPLTWHQLYAANHGVVGSNPDLIHAGEQLCIPAG